MMRVILFIVLLFALCSCNLEKRVVVTTSGYERYRQAGMTDTQIECLQRSDAACMDSQMIFRFE